MIMIAANIQKRDIRLEASPSIGEFIGSRFIIRLPETPSKRESPTKMESTSISMLKAVAKIMNGFLTTCLFICARICT